VDGGEVVEVDGLVVALTNLPEPSLNGAVVAREPDEPDAAVAAAEEEFRRRGHPFFGIELERGRHPAVEEAVRHTGLTLLLSRPAMAAPLDDLLVGPAVPSGVRIVRLEDPNDLPELRAVDLDAFRGDPDVTARFLGPGMLASDHNRVFLAREGLRAIGAGTAWSLLGTVGIFGIAVVRSARGRGIGTALTLTAARAFPDIDLAWLYPTDLARPLYERLGFRAVGDWDIWVRQS